MKDTNNTFRGTNIFRNEHNTGLSIEEDLRIKLANKEPIEANSPMYYTERKDGVLPQYDIRTDRQEIALDAIEKAEKSKIMRGDDANIENEKANENEQQNEQQNNV